MRRFLTRSSTAGSGPISRDPMMEVCQCNPVSEMQAKLAAEPCKMHCPMCDGMDHHWMPDCDEDNGMPVMVCKHCEARRPYTDEDEEI